MFVAGGTKRRGTDMRAALEIFDELYNPLDRLEQLAIERDWPFERPGTDELAMIVEGSWSDLQMSLSWNSEVEGLHLASTLELKVPKIRQNEVIRLVAQINEQLYFGHFDVWRQDGSVLYRNGLTLAGGAEASDAQCDSLIIHALEASETYYPAFQFVIWAGKTADEAMSLSLFETRGEA